MNSWRVLGKAGIVLSLCLLTVIAAQAQVLSVLANFDGTNGSEPTYMSLVQGRDGHLYGTTYFGGDRNAGVIFRITRTGLLTRLYSFCSEYACFDGENPNAGLTLGDDGNLYGTTTAAGDAHGTVYRMTPQGELTDVYKFCSQGYCPVGDDPSAPLILGSDRNFYGTTVYGGDINNCFEMGCGTVFRMSPKGNRKTVHEFEPGEGFAALGGVIEGIDGSLYGTTVGGGNTPCPDNGGCGTVFKISPSGDYATTYNFCAEESCPDGANPMAGLLQTSDGTLYGTTEGGGLNYCLHGCGTIFSITTDGTLATLHSFDGFDGELPMAPLIQASDGNFYSTTFAGGAFGSGSIFRFHPADGTVETVYDFCGLGKTRMGPQNRPGTECDDGDGPRTGLVQATNGVLYGTTTGGGTNGLGIVFALNLNLPPFVALVQDAGKVGGVGGILGQGFTGTTEVSLNGTPMTFQVISDTFLKAKVPPGATSGYITVTTPRRKLQSNRPFRVLP